MTLFPLDDISVSMLAPVSDFDRTPAKPPKKEWENTIKGTGTSESVYIRERLGGPSRQAVADGAHSTLIKEYEARLAIARERFDQHPAVRTLFRDPIDPVTLEAFLISFAIVGVHD